MWIVLLFEVTPFEYNHCLNNLNADCSELVKDVLFLLHEHSVIQLICKEIAPPQTRSLIVHVLRK